MRIRIFSAMFVIVLAAASMWQVRGFAADDAQGALSSAQTPNTPSASDAIKASDNAVVSLDFQDADIKNVLKVLAFKSGLNIVAAPDVTGVVTIQLNDVPWQKALEVILSTYGYG